MKEDYRKSLAFWNDRLAIDDEMREEYKKEIKSEDDWKELTTSEKFSNIFIDTLSGQKKVLDYGCGYGWAGIMIKKSGCKDVTCVDLIENGIEHTKVLASLFGISEGFRAECVSEDWIATSPEGVYDGLICSNVLDVVPAEIAANIIENIARITTADAKIVIGMNYYTEPKDNPERNTVVKNGNEMYTDGILRLVPRTDEEWKEIFGKYFSRVSVDHYAWQGEAKETRRIFVLGK